jgi:hypothetical protein
MVDFPEACGKGRAFVRHDGAVAEWAVAPGTLGFAAVENVLDTSEIDWRKAVPPTLSRRFFLPERHHTACDSRSCHGVITLPDMTRGYSRGVYATVIARNQ